MSGCACDHWPHKDSCPYAHENSRGRHTMNDTEVVDEFTAIIAALATGRILPGDALRAVMDESAARVAAARADAEKVHRDLTGRLGFGDDITEPMADNDTIVAWFEEQCRDASEWRESQRWRDDCYAAGHPDDEDCWEHDPTLRAVAAARADALAPVLALADEWERQSYPFRNGYAATLRAAVAVPEPEERS